MWLSDAQSPSNLPMYNEGILLTCFISEIGVALTTFGGLFMLLGVMLFFDGALLALGNVRPNSSQLTTQTSKPLILFSKFTDPLHFGFDADHWSPKDILLFCQETEDSWDGVFPGRNPPRFYEMAVYWNARGDLWIFESFRVCNFQVSYR